MEGQEEQLLDFAILNPKDWRMIVFRWVVFLVMMAIIYQAGRFLDIWVRIAPHDSRFRPVAGLLITVGAGIILYQLYIQSIPRWLFKTYFEGVIYRNAGDYDAALEAFKQYYDLFDQHPARDRLYDLLSLNPSRLTNCEMALSNQSGVYFLQHDRAGIVSCNEQWLALNPDSELATNTLNFIAAITGGELRPLPRHIPYAAYEKGGRPGPRWWRILSNIISLALTLGLAFFLCDLVRTAGWYWGRDLTVVGLAAAMFSKFIVDYSISLIQWAAARLLLMDFYQAERLLRKGQYREAVRAFQEQVVFLKENPWIDEWRWVFLPNSGPYSYQEWSLVRMAYGYVQLGEGDQLLPIYEQILDLNPRNGLAHTNINFINLFRENE